MTKYLITGGAGFIGSHFVEKLLKDKENYIRILVLRGESLKNLPHGKYDLVVGDLKNKKTIKGLAEGIDYVIHLGALVMKPEYNKKDYFETNVDGTKYLLEEVSKRKVKGFIFFSSIAVFGLPAFNGDMNNVSENSPHECKEVYGQSKNEAEKLVKKYSERYSFNHIIIRPTTVYGPRDHQNLLELYKVVNKGLYFVIGSGKNKMNYVFVEDLVDGVLKAVGSGVKNEDYILGGPKTLTQLQVSKTVASSIGRKVPKFKIPLLVALIGSWVVSKFLGVFGQKSPIFPDRVKVLTRNCYFNLNKARQDFGYNPKTSFKKGTKITSEWLMDNMLL